MSIDERETKRNSKKGEERTDENTKLNRRIMLQVHHYNSTILGTELFDGFDERVEGTGMNT
jgi:hypothetical protein